MKQIFFLLFLFSSFLFAQNWNDAVTTGINLSTTQKVDMFTTSEGNHVVVQNSGSSNSLKYYLINSQGQLITNSNVETAGGSQFPNIIVNNGGEILVTYQLGSNLYTKKSTNGTTWTAYGTASLNNSSCNGVDVAYDFQEGILHVTWATKDNADSYETWYNNNQDGSFGQNENVSNSDIGGFPTIAISTDRVHIGYNTGNSAVRNGNTGAARVRTKYLGNNFGSFQIVQNNSGSEFLAVYGSYLYNFPFALDVNPDPDEYDLIAKRRSLDGTNWSTAPNFSPGDPQNLRIESFIGSVLTNNNKLNIVYDDIDNTNLEHRYYDGNDWTDPITAASSPSATSNIAVSHFNNDIYVIWKSSNSNYLKLVQYDSPPATPPNFIGELSGNHPYLIWGPVEDPDLDGYEIYWQTYSDPKYPGPWNLLTTVTVNSFIDQGVIVGSSTNYVNYKIRSKDVGENTSNYTNIVSYTYTGLNKEDVEKPVEAFKLSDNYPNPFNPSTTISFSIPERSFVTLKVYDILGREIANLVNEELKAGSFEKTFDASTLSSGVYIYRITAMKDGKILFNESKQMLMIK
ncbi:MAG TPA: T9SS type A sorting domain-containing protein [Ignavibacteriaceae bacterium]|nr:T9SS type A sorting domain-containing protein [Ignavibacteriaceae bacterium]